jgi:hypothetical protein
VKIARHAVVNIQMPDIPAPGHQFLAAASSATASSINGDNQAFHKYLF